MSNLSSSVVERQTLNLLVVGSSPTMGICKYDWYIYFNIFIMLNSELLPRRFSLQFCPIKKKKFNNLLKWVNLEKINNKNHDLNFEFLLKFNNLNLFKKVQIIIPFQERIEKKIFYLVLPNEYRKFKEQLVSFLSLKSIGKVTNLAKFLTKIKKKSAKKLTLINNKSILIDKTLKEIEKEAISLIFKKKKTNFFKINLKNNISNEIIKVLSKNSKIFKNFTNFLMKISKNFCIKSLQKNIFNLIGGIFEKIYLGPNLISKISLKTQLLPNLYIYLKK